MEASIEPQSKGTPQKRISIFGACTLFGVLCAISIGLWWRPLTATFLLAIRGDAYTQILLAVPISVILIAIDFGKSRWTPVFGVRWGAVLLFASAMLCLVALYGIRIGLADDVLLTAEISALVLCWIGAFVLCFGTRISRRCIFPLIFLLWLVPMPLVVVNGVITFLQHGTATLTHLMLALVGIPVKQYGEILSLPGLTIEVAQECSSVRSSLLLIVCAMVMAYVLLRSSWGRATVMLAAIPLAIFKNALRVFTLSVLSAYVDPAIMNGRLHRQGGVLFFAIALLLLMALIWLIRNIERKRADRFSANPVQDNAISPTQLTQQSLG